VANIDAPGAREARVPGQYPCAVLAPQEIFWSPHYMRHNQRRQEHLASLGLDLTGQTVLEVGAGLGDHTSFFIDRGCSVVVSEAQEQNLGILRARYPELDIRRINLDEPPAEPEVVDIVYCYGTLYHLERPAEAIAWMADCAEKLLLVETCVAFGEAEEIHPFEERAGQPDNAVAGHGCRPTRAWVRHQLTHSFPHVYCTVTQPWHEEFPLDWSNPDLAGKPLIRAVFVASRSRIENSMLTDSIPALQVRH
jgi:SAM-dependent methyltransferase